MCKYLNLCMAALAALFLTSSFGWASEQTRLAAAEHIGKQPLVSAKSWKVSKIVAALEVATPRAGENCVFEARFAKPREPLKRETLGMDGGSGFSLRRLRSEKEGT